MFLFDGYGLVPCGKEKGKKTPDLSIEDIIGGDHVSGIFNLKSVENMVCQPYMIKYMLPQKETKFKKMTIERYELYNTETEEMHAPRASLKSTFDHIDSEMI